jgi:hypothetical protein
MREGKKVGGVYAVRGERCKREPASPRGRRDPSSRRAITVEARATSRYALRTVYEPRLIDGDSYGVMLRNLSRLLRSGRTIEEARPIVLAQACVNRFPSPPAHRLPRVGIVVLAPDCV